VLRGGTGLVPVVFHELESIDFEGAEIARSRIFQFLGEGERISQRGAEAHDGHVGGFEAITSVEGLAQASRLEFAAETISAGV
jgi:hypothetical protein